MNPQLKTIILKEVKEVSGRKDYLFNMFVNIVLCSAVGVIYALASTGPAQVLLTELNLIIFPPFVMFLVSFPFIQEKFSDEKLVLRFEALLTTPNSLKTIWVGKMASIILLSYPIVIIAMGVLLVTSNVLTGLNPLSILSMSVWITVIFVGPSVPILYACFSSWSILRFTHPELMNVIKYFALGGAILVFITSGHVAKSIARGQLVNWPILTYSTLGLISLFCIIFFLIERLDKEKITV